METPKLVFGAMTIGKSGAIGARVTNLKDCAAMLDVLQKHGFNEVDTARVYGASEELLGQLRWQERGIIMGTKLNPNKRFGPTPYSHSKDDLERGMTDSLKALQTDSVDLWYLHTPDHDTPYIETLEAVNNLYNAGHFSRFGISNYAAWEVAQIYQLCKEHGWKTPDVYQGCYHALQRNVEPELFPCLRHYGIAFYAFSPLAGGLLTDKYNLDMDEVEQGCRYDPKSMQGQNFRKRYWNDAHFKALNVIRRAASSSGLKTSEAALRWLAYHSRVKKDKGDGIITGASGPEQLDDNLTSLKAGPLPPEMVDAFEEAWFIVRGACAPYFM